MKINKALTAGLLLSAAIIPAYAQLPVVSGLLGDSLNTAPVQLLGLAAPVLNIAGLGTSSLSGLIPGGANLPLVDTLLGLPELGSGLIGVGVPLGSGIILNGGIDGLLGLGAGLPVLGDVIPLVDGIPPLALPL